MVGGNFILLAIIRLSVIETNQDRISRDPDNQDTCCLDQVVIETIKTNIVLITP